MRILYTPEELDRTIRWYPFWIAAAVAILVVRHFWVPGTLRATEVSCELLAASLWGISKSRSSPDIRGFAMTLGSIGVVLSAMFLAIRFFGLRNMPGAPWLGAIDFALGARILMSQITILASVYVCHRGLDDVEDAVLVADAV